MNDKNNRNQNDKIIQFTQNDIENFENKYKLKALKKDKNPSKAFMNWLTMDDSHIVKKTVVKLSSMNDMYSNKQVKNLSYEVPVNSNELELKISELISEVQKYKNNDIKKQEIQDKIKELIQENQSNELFPMNTNIQALDVNAQDNLLDMSENYIAYVYFFWSPETMNFKIIGLHSINSLFEFANIKQTFYLTKPAMITNDCPIYFCFDKVPYSISLDVKDDLIELTNYFIKEGQTSDIFYFMEKNKTFIRVYGFNKIPLRIWIDFILVIAFICMLEYVLLYNIFVGSG